VGGSGLGVDLALVLFFWTDEVEDSVVLDTSLGLSLLLLLVPALSADVWFLAPPHRLSAMWRVSIALTPCSDSGLDSMRALDR
jgi:hypothetical protein